MSEDWNHGLSPLALPLIVLRDASMLYLLWCIVGFGCGWLTYAHCFFSIDFFSFIFFFSNGGSCSF